MTKKQIIESIQKAESQLWLDLAFYDYQNAPRNGCTESDIEWDMNNEGHRYHVHAWSRVHMILEAINAPCAEDENHRVAYDYSSMLWDERQKARGKA